MIEEVKHKESVVSSSDQYLPPSELNPDEKISIKPKSIYGSMSSSKSNPDGSFNKNYINQADASPQNTSSISNSASFLTVNSKANSEMKQAPSKTEDINPFKMSPQKPVNFVHNYGEPDILNDNRIRDNFSNEQKEYI